MQLILLISLFQGPVVRNNGDISETDEDLPFDLSLSKPVLDYDGLEHSESRHRPNKRFRRFKRIIKFIKIGNKLIRKGVYKNNRKEKSLKIVIPEDTEDASKDDYDADLDDVKTEERNDVKTVDSDYVKIRMDLLPADLQEVQRNAETEQKDRRNEKIEPDHNDHNDRNNEEDKESVWMDDNLGVGDIIDEVEKK